MIFVYNFDRGNLSALKDYSQKRIEDRAPECNLFALISSPVGIKKSWKRYIQQLRLPARFLHHDEYEEEFGALLTTLPAIFLHDQKARSIIVSSDELRTVATLDDLIALLNQKLGALSR